MENENKVCDVYEECPVFENENYKIRFVSDEDCMDLLKVYSDIDSLRLFNSDNCNGDEFYYTTSERMKKAIGFWKFQYNNREFVRWSIIDKRENAVIGTIELFHRKWEDFFNNCGLLRLDLRSYYEEEDIIVNILNMVLESAYELFDCEMIATKCIYGARERNNALTRLGFERTDHKLVGRDGTEYSSYYYKMK